MALKFPLRLRMTVTEVQDTQPLCVFSVCVCFCLLVCTLSCLSSAHPSWMRALMTSLFPTMAARCNAVCSPCQRHKHTSLTTNMQHSRNRIRKPAPIHKEIYFIMWKSWSSNLLFHCIIHLQCICSVRFRTLNYFWLTLLKKSCWKVKIEIQDFHTSQVTVSWRNKLVLRDMFYYYFLLVE